MFPSLQNLFLNLLGNAFWSIYKPQKKICFTIYRLFYNLSILFCSIPCFLKKPTHTSLSLFLFIKLGSEFFQNSDVGFKKQSILCATRTWVFLKHNLVILMLKVTQKFPFLRSWSADICDGHSNLWAADPACLYSPDPSPPAHTVPRLPWPLEGADLGHLRESRISVSSSPIPLALRHPPHPHSPPDPIIWLLKAGHQGLAQVAQSSFCARIFIALSVTVPFTFGT